MEQIESTTQNCIVQGQISHHKLGGLRPVVKCSLGLGKPFTLETEVSIANYSSVCKVHGIGIAIQNIFRE